MYVVLGEFMDREMKEKDVFSLDSIFSNFFIFVIFGMLTFYDFIKKIYIVNFNVSDNVRFILEMGVAFSAIFVTLFAFFTFMIVSPYSFKFKKIYFFMSLLTSKLSKKYIVIKNVVFAFFLLILYVILVFVFLAEIKYRSSYDFLDYFLIAFLVYYWCVIFWEYWNKYIILDGIVDVEKSFSKKSKMKIMVFKTYFFPLLFILSTVFLLIILKHHNFSHLIPGMEFYFIMIFVLFFLLLFFYMFTRKLEKLIKILKDEDEFKRLIDRIKREREKFH